MRLAYESVNTKTAESHTAKDGWDAPRLQPMTVPRVSKEGYYVYDAGRIIAGPFQTLSEAFTQTPSKPGPGRGSRFAVGYLNNGAGDRVQPFPLNLLQVNGSQHIASIKESSMDEFLWEDDTVAPMSRTAAGKSKKVDCPECGEKVNPEDLHINDHGVKHPGVIHERGSGYKPKEGSLNTQHREAQLLAAMAWATRDEQIRIMGELTDLRQRKTAAKAASEELDLSDTLTRHLTPVQTHTQHSAATDWLADASYEDPATDMLTEASLWYRRVPADIKADSHELFTQAVGVGERVASSFADSEGALHLFLNHVAALHMAEGQEDTQEDTSGMESARPGVSPWEVVFPPLPAMPIIGDNYNDMAGEPPMEWGVLPLSNGQEPGSELAGQASRRMASDNFTAPRMTYEQYQSRIPAGQAQMSREAFEGSLAAVAPAPDEVTSRVASRREGFTPDPKAEQLGTPNIVPGDNAKGDNEQAAWPQAGMAGTSLPFVPTGPDVSADNPYTHEDSWPDTGEAQHDGNPIINSRQGVFERWAKDFKDGDYDDDDMSNDNKGGFDTDRSSYPASPSGDAAFSGNYENAISSDRAINYTDTDGGGGIGTNLGTVPVEGYAANPSGEMWPFTIKNPSGYGGYGAAAVGDVPTPGQSVSDYPQPSKTGGLAALRFRIAQRV